MARKIIASAKEWFNFLSDDIKDLIEQNGPYNSEKDVEDAVSEYVVHDIYKSASPESNALLLKEFYGTEDLVDLAWVVDDDNFDNQNEMIAALAEYCGVDLVKLFVDVYSSKSQAGDVINFISDYMDPESVYDEILADNDVESIILDNIKLSDYVTSEATARRHAKRKRYVR